MEVGLDRDGACEEDADDRSSSIRSNGSMSVENHTPIRLTSHEIPRELATTSSPMHPAGWTRNPETNGETSSGRDYADNHGYDHQTLTTDTFVSGLSWESFPSTHPKPWV